MGTCPYCKSELNQGATVCAHCNAYKGVKADDTSAGPIGCMIFILIGLGLIFGFGAFISFSGHRPDFILGLFFIALLAGCIYLIRKIFKKLSEPVWLRGK